MKTEWIALDSIETGERSRPLDESHVKRLVASIREIGLQTPITVMARRDDDGWRSILVAGAHRLAALRELGEEGADCFILPDDQDAADLWEIDENFARSELTDAQRADHHVRREAILVRRGEVLAGAGQPKKNSDKLSGYSKMAAADLGVDERTIRRDLARGKKIAPDVLADVAGTDLDKGVVLDELAATPRDEQRDKLAEIEHRRSVVRMAPDPLNDPEAHEKQLAALMSAWNRAAAVVRQEFLLRVEGPVFDRGAA
jgi:ParB-like chromosome segregation protein Spo0J